MRQEQHRRPKRRPRGAIQLCFISLLACTGSSGETESSQSDASTQGSTTASQEPMELVIADAWVHVEEAADPLADHRPETVDCGIGGLFVELGELDIDTNLCNYVMIEQPGLAAVPEGATLTLSMRHFDLTAPEPATAHVALLLGDTLAWERVLPIPGPAEVISVDITAPVALPPGGPVRFHLHNHGQNTWILTGIKVTP